MRRKIIVTGIVGLVYTFIFCLDGQGQTAHVVELTATDTQVRMAAYRRILDEREQTSVSLINITKTDTSPSCRGGKSLAIQLLGELRTTRAVDLLVQNLMFCPLDRPQEESIPTQGYYVAAVSLVKIGSPAVGSVLAKMRKTEDEEEAQLCVWILKEILGPEEVIRSIEKVKMEPDARIRARGVRMEEHLNAFKPKFGPPTKTK